MSFSKCKLQRNIARIAHCWEVDLDQLWFGFWHLLNTNSNWTVFCQNCDCSTGSVTSKFAKLSNSISTLPLMILILKFGMNTINFSISMYRFNMNNISHFKWSTELAKWDRHFLISCHFFLELWQNHSSYICFRKRCLGYWLSHAFNICLLLNSMVRGWNVQHI